MEKIKNKEALMMQVRHLIAIYCYVWFHGCTIDSVEYKEYILVAIVMLNFKSCNIKIEYSIVLGV